MSTSLISIEDKINEILKKKGMSPDSAPAEVIYQIYESIQLAEEKHQKKQLKRQRWKDLKIKLRRLLWLS